jgi:hypothetical protein
MAWQALLAGLIVALCSAHALWVLMPASLRARCRAALGRAAPPATGCSACGGCGTPAAPRADGTQVVRVVRPNAG